MLGRAGVPLASPQTFFGLVTQSSFFVWEKDCVTRPNNVWVVLIVRFFESHVLYYVDPYYHACYHVL